MELRHTPSPCFRLSACRLARQEIEPKVSTVKLQSLTHIAGFGTNYSLDPKLTCNIVFAARRFDFVQVWRYSS